MKKRERKFLLILISLFFLVFTGLSFISADETSKIDDAYKCLDSLITQKSCVGLSLEEKIFSLLVTGRCESELKSDSNRNECWPRNNCNIKSTAQAILALGSTNTNTNDAEKWLISRNRTTENMIWYLQIETSKPTTCKIEYNNFNYNININEEKKLRSGAGSCLTLSASGYWLTVSQNCFGTDFKISCEESFLTNLLFREKDSETIYVSRKTNTASALGTTTEKVNSFCLASGSSCDYEGTLWASAVLDSKGYDISAYIPYLISGYKKNPQHLPEVFLFILTNYDDFRNELLLKQKSNQYWQESGDRFYDTALALLPFQYSSVNEKQGAKNWLLEVQGANGCWENNIRNTAFILYSVWNIHSYLPPVIPPVTPGELNFVNLKNFTHPSNESFSKSITAVSESTETITYSLNDTFKFQINSETGLITNKTPFSEEEVYFLTILASDNLGNSNQGVFYINITHSEEIIKEPDNGISPRDCEDAGYYCVSAISCEGNLFSISEYFCSGAFRCCDKPIAKKTCSDYNGVICNQGESCVGGRVETEATGLGYGQTCCVLGLCEKQIEPSISECEQKGGVCRISCFEDEESDYYSCSIFSDSCCFESGTLTPPKPKSKWWIWVLVILILLTLLGIIFRDKLRPYYYKYFSKSGGPLSRLQRRPPFPPPRGGVPLRTMPPLTRGPISPGNFQKPRTPSTPQTGPGVPRPGVPPQRKILPPQANQQTQKKDSGKNPELEDVLKKLKDMGK